MRFLPRASWLVLGALLGLLAGVHAASPFEGFIGSYEKRGNVRLSQQNERLGSGKVRLRVTAGPREGTANLVIRGELRIGGAMRRIRARVGFQAAPRAVLTNLAPGYEDGGTAIGAYETTATDISGTFPFQIRTTTGTATISVRVRQNGRRKELVVTQTLAASTLAAPLVWRFAARSR